MATKTTTKATKQTPATQASKQAPAKQAPTKTTKAAPTKATPTKQATTKQATAKEATTEQAPAKATTSTTAQDVKPYIRKDRTRRATGSRVQVLDLFGSGAPADAIKHKDGQPFAVHCVTHGAVEHHKTYGAAYKASKVSHEWCGKCQLVNAESVTKQASK